VQHVEPLHDAALVALLQDIRIALRELRDLPRLAELLRRLVVVRAPQDGVVCRAGHPMAHAVTVPRLEREGQDADVLRHARDARVERGVGEQIAPLELHVPLPRTAERLAHKRPPAARAYRGQGLGRVTTPDAYLEPEDPHGAAPVHATRASNIAHMACVWLASAPSRMLKPERRAGAVASLCNS